MNIKCRNCRFWESKKITLNDNGHAHPINREVTDREVIEDHVAGNCRRRPPISMPSVGGGFRAFPITLGKDWCGEFESVPQTAREAIEVADAPPKKPSKKPSVQKSVDNPPPSP